jgi:hypothetical protein
MHHDPSPFDGAAAGFDSVESEDVEDFSELSDFLSPPSWLDEDAEDEDGSTLPLLFA